MGWIDSLQRDLANAMSCGFSCWPTLHRGPAVGGKAARAAHRVAVFGSSPEGEGIPPDDYNDVHRRALDTAQELAGAVETFIKAAQLALDADGTC
ncbi:hypothetical protein [Streptomyces rimosus]|uniref:hypothetical protein n=1 Tax=Streptomyces rimosus TaxID=1927 RepID=UPI000AE9E3AA|nr:hypothetical protein [Streptomyces rimosus]